MTDITRQDCEQRYRSLDIETGACEPSPSPCLS